MFGELANKIMFTGVYYLSSEFGNVWNNDKLSSRKLHGDILYLRSSDNSKLNTILNLLTWTQEYVSR